MTKKYAETHEWVVVKGDIATVGVSDFAQRELGDIVYVELPVVGKRVKAGQEAAVLESTKAAADVYAPVSGEVVEVNGEVSAASELINKSPEERGWLFRVRLEDPKELEGLMSHEAYMNQFAG